MGGLLVYFDREGCVLPHPSIAAMRGEEKHRGEATFCSDGPLALGALRLGFEDDPAAVAPEAIAAVHGYFFGSRGISSARALLDGYRAEGEAFFRRVDGEFAIVLWDLKARTLYLCRDSFGTKPLYYACDGRRLAVASEIRQVLRSGVVPAAVNRSKLASDLGAGRAVPEETLFAGVWRVLPSQLIRFSPTLTRESAATWAPPATVDRRRNEQEVLDELPRLIARSIARRRWRKPALTLSSGIDSAALAGVVSSDHALREQFSNGSRPRAITLSYRGWDCDEAGEAGRYARRLQIEQAVVDATGAGPFEAAGELAEACDQPYGTTAYEVLLILREARRLGHGSVATGLGAEYSWETVPRLAADLLRQGRWGRLLRETTERVGPAAGKKVRFVWREAVRPWIGEGARRSGLRRGRPASGLKERGVPESLTWKWKAAQMTGARSSQQLEVLEQLAAREGIEMIHPFLDREMAEFAFRTPPHLLGTLTDRKRLFARAMARLVPDQLWERPKTLSPGSFAARSLRTAVESLGPPGAWRLSSLLGLAPQDEKLLRCANEGDLERSSSRIWDLACHEFWLRRHFPGANDPVSL